MIENLVSQTILICWFM